MSFLALTFIFLTVFAAVQLHNETSHLIDLGSNVLSSQPEWLLMSAKNYTEGTLSHHEINDYVNQVFVLMQFFIYCIFYTVRVWLYMFLF